jgi:hypothetical protein
MFYKPWTARVVHLFSAPASPIVSPPSNRTMKGLAAFATLCVALVAARQAPLVNQAPQSLYYGNGGGEENWRWTNCGKRIEIR